MFKNNAERETTILIFNKFANGADHHLITTIIKYGTVVRLGASRSSSQKLAVAVVAFLVLFATS